MQKRFVYMAQITEFSLSINVDRILKAKILSLDSADQKHRQIRLKKTTNIYFGFSNVLWAGSHKQEDSRLIFIHLMEERFILWQIVIPIP